MITKEDTISIPERACAPTCDASAAAGAGPPDIDPERMVNWRFRCAMDLLDHSHGAPPKHADPWVQAMIDFGTVSVLKHRAPTETDIAVYNALAILRSDSLAKHLLEARLLNQQSPEEIHRRSGLPTRTVTAYSKLLFDVSEATRKGVWLLNPSATATVTDSPMSRFGLRLKSLACCSTSGELERHISSLQGIQGKTMAGGLPPRKDSAFAEEVGERIKLAQALLPISPAAERTLGRFHKAVARDVAVGRATSVSLDLALDFLHKAKIPKDLQRQLRQARHAGAIN